jgi:hypothetical protein
MHMPTVPPTHGNGHGSYEAETGLSMWARYSIGPLAGAA